MDAWAVEYRSRSGSPGAAPRPHLWAAVALSLLLHALGGVTASRLGVGADGDASSHRLAWTNRALAPAAAPLTLDWSPPPEIEEPPPPEPARAEITPLAMPPQPRPEASRLKLGIEDSKQPTDNVMGFNDPTEHAARESEVDQPALDPAPGGVVSPPPSPPVPPPRDPGAPPASQPPEVAAPMPGPPLGTPPAAEREFAKPAERPASPDAPDLTIGPPTPMPPNESEPPQAERTAAPRGEGDERSEPSPEVIEGVKAPEMPGVGPREGEAEPKPASLEKAPGKDVDEPGTGTDDRHAVKREPVHAPPPAPMEPDPLFSGEDTVPDAPAPTSAAAPAPQPPTPMQPPSDATNPGPPGERSEKEADAASKTKPIEVVLGRPAAGEGLEIITKRPKRNPFSLLTRVMAYPSNPVIEVQFDRAGRVSTAKIVKSSGVADVDGPVLAAVYTWTARGKRLTELPANDPRAAISITVTILLR